MKGVLRLPSLARSRASDAAELPGTGLRVRSVRSRESRQLAGSQWFILLAGDLIVDLPYGDFRRLLPGDACRFEAGVDVVLNPLAPCVVLEADV